MHLQGESGIPATGKVKYYNLNELPRPAVLQTGRATTQLLILLYGPCPRLLRWSKTLRNSCQRWRRRALNKWR